MVLMLMVVMRWEHQRLSMQKEDLEEKWREIQQTKLSKENQRALGESSQVIAQENLQQCPIITIQASSSQEFSALDRANKQREVFHAKKMEELGNIMASFEEMIEAKKKDNELLEVEVVKLEKELKEEERELEAQSKAAEEEMAKVLIVH